MKVTFNQHIAVFENAYPDEWCDLIVQKYEQYKDHALTRDKYWKIGKDGEYLAVDSSLTFSQLKDEIKDPEFNKYGELFGDVLHQCFQLYKKKYQLSHPGFTFFDNKIQKTTPKQGYHVWHIEDMSLISDDMEGFQLYEFLTRFGVYTVYLNDVEEGGETEFLMQSLRISPKKGTLCLFPSSYTHLHRGNPPLKGNKYICTGWLHIPDTRENKNIILDNNE